VIFLKSICLRQLVICDTVPLSAVSNCNHVRVHDVLVTATSIFCSKQFLPNSFHLYLDTIIPPLIEFVFLETGSTILLYSFNSNTCLDYHYCSSYQW